MGQQYHVHLYRLYREKYTGITTDNIVADTPEDAIKIVLSGEAGDPEPAVDVEDVPQFAIVDEIDPETTEINADHPDGFSFLVGPEDEIVADDFTDSFHPTIQRNLADAAQAALDFLDFLDDEYGMRKTGVSDALRAALAKAKRALV